MKSYRSLFFLLMLIPVMHLTANAQSDFSFAAGGGAIYYNGDLSDKTYIPPFEIINAFYSADVSMLIIDRMDLSLRYLHGNVEGADSLSKEKDNLRRNESFTSRIDEFGLVLRYRLFSVRSKRAFNPYAMLGLGYFWFNPQAELNGIKYDLQPLGTEGQFIQGGGYAKPYKLHSTSFTMGLGVFMRINDQWSLRFEASPQLTFTDYLDDVSTIYPDSTALSHTPNGAIAVMLSSLRPKGFPDRGRARGNSTNNDVMVTFGLSVVFTPQPKSKISSRPPGVYHKIFKGKAGWWGEAPN